METQTVKSNWLDVKGKIKARFDKLSDETIESVKGNLDLLSSKLQSTYGYAKEQAEKEFAGFKESLHTATAPEKHPVTETKPHVEPAAITPIAAGAKKVA
jgi:uncharacterized protein YjbJ (UPF0337 family)